MAGESALGLTFTVEVDAASDLTVDATRADALITVRARPAAGHAADPQGAEILIMDRSLSMASRAKLGEAKRAICAAIDTLRDGSFLGIIAGNDEAETVYPARGGLARVDTGTKKAAKRRVTNTRPEGGTAIGRWLTLAGQLFEAAPAGTVRHAVLYTDGKNEHESSGQLGTALASCADRFVCDARGLGDDWNYAELLRITEALHGTAEAVINIPDLTADFVRLMTQAQRLVVPRVYLSLRLNERFRVGFVRQTHPVESDLTNLQQNQGREIHVPLGAWAAGTRQYHLSLRFEHHMLPVGEDLRAARVELRAETPGGAREPCAAAAVVVRRHATPGFKPGKPDDLTRAENARELGMAMRACADAWQNGDTAAADRELRLALERARHLGDDRRRRLLEAVTAVSPDGLARLRLPRSPLPSEPSAPTHSRIAVRHVSQKMAAAPPTGPPASAGRTQRTTQGTTIDLADRHAEPVPSDTMTCAQAHGASPALNLLARRYRSQTGHHRHPG